MDKKASFANIAKKAKVDSFVPAPKASKGTDRATFYYRGTDIGERISEVCRDHGITQQDFLWFACNLAFTHYGAEPIEQPEDGRRAGVIKPHPQTVAKIRNVIRDLEGD